MLALVIPIRVDNSSGAAAVGTPFWLGPSGPTASQQAEAGLRAAWHEPLPQARALRLGVA